MSPISFISTPPVIGLPSYLFKSILLEIQFLYNIWRYPYSWPGSSIFIFAVLLGFHCYKSVFPSISVWQDGSSIGRIDLPLSQKVVESTLGRMAPKKAWQDIGPMPRYLGLTYFVTFWPLIPPIWSKIHKVTSRDNRLTRERQNAVFINAADGGDGSQIVGQIDESV